MAASFIAALLPPLSRICFLVIRMVYRYSRQLDWLFLVAWGPIYAALVGQPALKSTAQ